MSDTKNPLLIEESPTVAPEGTVAVATQRQERTRRRILPSTSPKFIVGTVLVLAIVLFAIIAPIFAQNPRSTDNPALAAPSAEHWLGTTKLGNDVFAQLAVGAQGSLLIGVTAGVLSAVKRDSWIDYVVNVLSLCGISTPNFWLGIMLILLFSVQLGWLPASGYVSPFENPSSRCSPPSCRPSCSATRSPASSCGTRARPCCRRWRATMSAPRKRRGCPTRPSS